MFACMGDFKSGDSTPHSKNWGAPGTPYGHPPGDARHLAVRGHAGDRLSLDSRLVTCLKNAGDQPKMPESVASHLVRRRRFSIGPLVIGCGEALLAGECCSC